MGTGLWKCKNSLQEEPNLKNETRDLWEAWKKQNLNLKNKAFGGRKGNV